MNKQEISISARLREPAMVAIEAMSEFNEVFLLFHRLPPPSLYLMFFFFSAFSHPSNFLMLDVIFLPLLILSDYDDELWVCDAREIYLFSSICVVDFFSTRQADSDILYVYSVASIPIAILLLK